MPTYEYECKKCTHKFEVFQKITEKALTACPVCQGPIQRLIGKGAGFIFKGSGFYATDYRSKEYKEREKQETNANSSTCPGSKDNKTCKECPANKVESKK